MHTWNVLGARHNPQGNTIDSCNALGYCNSYYEVFNGLHQNCQDK